MFFILVLCYSFCVMSIRYTLSFYNKSHSNYPLFTLQANVIGSLISSVCYILSLHGSGSGLDSQNGQLFMSAIGLGFAGGLSTVSTFVNECRLLRGKTCYQYMALTFSCGQFIVISLIFLWGNFGERKGG